MVKTSDESITLIERIFQQGDARYENPYSVVMVASFLDNKAIEIETSSIKHPANPSEDDLKQIGPPQSQYKFIAKKFLEEEGYKVMGFEISFQGGRVAY